MAEKPTLRVVPGDEPVEPTRDNIPVRTIWNRIVKAALRRAGVVS